MIYDLFLALPWNIEQGYCFLERAVLCITQAVSYIYQLLKSRFLLDSEL